MTAAKRKPVKFSEIMVGSTLETRRIADNVEALGYKVVSTGLEHPSSIIYYIECPFCLDVVKTYLWSLSGGGKRCHCGALFGSLGAAYKWKESP